MNRGRCAWVFAGGDFSPKDILRDQQSPDDLHICVDRGVEHCLLAGLQPTYLIGDFDSVSQDVLKDKRLKHVPRQVHPSRKAASDLELALQWLADNPPGKVVLLGVSGGRTDHMLFNWCLPQLRDWPFELQLIDATTHAYLVTDKFALDTDIEVGQTVSLLALSNSSGISTTGLEYELSDALMSPGSTLGLSNVAEERRITVALDSGKILVLVQRNYSHQ